MCLEPTRTRIQDDSISTRQLDVSWSSFLCVVDSIPQHLTSIVTLKRGKRIATSVIGPSLFLRRHQHSGKVPGCTANQVVPGLRQSIVSSGRTLPCCSLRMEDSSSVVRCGIGVFGSRS